MRVDEILMSRSRELVSFGPSETILDAASVLRRNRIGAALVLDDDGGMLGIVSERDLVRRLAEQGAGALDGSIRDLMTTKVIACEPGNDLREVMHLMIDNEIRHLPVVERDRPVAMISMRDVVRAHIDWIEDENDQLRKLLVALK